MTLLLALVSSALANPTFRVHPVATPDGPGLATVWSDPQGAPLGTVFAAGELGMSDGWLKWLALSSWDTPMEVPLWGWGPAEVLTCDAFSGTETEFSGTETEFTGAETEFHGTETEFTGAETELAPCQAAVEGALRDASLAVLRDAGFVGPQALAAVDAQVAVVVAGLTIR